MLDPKSLWIGDRLRIKESDTIGTFEGMDSSTIVILKINDQFHKFQLSALDMAQEEVEPEIDLSENILPKFIPIQKPSHSIDLHIEVLAVELTHARPERILQQQLNSFNQFMDLAIIAKLPYVTIIHGRGEGILRAEIQSRLKQKYFAKIIQSINNDGATLAWL